MPAELPDAPGVILLPPIIPLAVLIVGVPLDWFAPRGMLAELPIGLRALGWKF
jgi:hypothetical protein